MSRAVILAGGKGTRLRPYTVVLPKPLMPVGEYPILEVILRQLAISGFDHVTMAVNHQAEIVKAFFGDGSKWSLHIDYSMETEPLSTMGPLRLIKDLPDDFLVMNGDVLTDLDYRAFFDEHVTARPLFTVAAQRREHLVDYGVLTVNESGTLTGFEEKPRLHYLVSMGVYIANRRVLDFIPAHRKFGFDTLMLDLIARGEQVRVRESTSYWLDIGRVDDYMRAVDEFEQKREHLLRGGR
jgi:NDP-mannose synthase